MTELVEELVKKEFTVTRIKAACRNTGMFPWNPEIILNRAKEFAAPETLDLGPQGPEERILAAVTKLVTPPRLDERKTRKITASFKSGAYTSEQLIEVAEENEERKEQMEQERQKRKEEKEEGARNKLEALLEKGKQLVIEKKANSASTWGNKNWLSENTCSVCRQQHSSAKDWMAPNCEAFWLCKRCLPIARNLIKVHENKCRECQREREEEKSQ